MELPLVRGSGMLTHLFTDAIPVVKPYCLNAINAVPATFECPEEESGESMKILLLLVLLRNPKEDIADTIIKRIYKKKVNINNKSTNNTTSCSCSSSRKVISLLILHIHVFPGKIISWKP